MGRRVRVGFELRHNDIVKDERPLYMRKLNKLVVIYTALQLIQKSSGKKRKLSLLSTYVPLEVKDLRLTC